MTETPLNLRILERKTLKTMTPYKLNAEESVWLIIRVANFSSVIFSITLRLHCHGEIKEFDFQMMGILLLLLLSLLISFHSYYYYYYYVFNLLLLSFFFRLAFFETLSLNGTFMWKPVQLICKAKDQFLYGTDIWH